ncbi:uncharacterized protein ACNLHF_015693 [Anomaloglossus baeobatrachus]
MFICIHTYRCTTLSCNSSYKHSSTYQKANTSRTHSDSSFNYDSQQPSTYIITKMCEFYINSCIGQPHRTDYIGVCRPIQQPRHQVFHSGAICAHCKLPSKDQRGVEDTVQYCVLCTGL